MLGRHLKIYVDQLRMQVFHMLNIDGTEFAEVPVVMMDFSNKKRTQRFDRHQRSRVMNVKNSLRPSDVEKQNHE
jgi:hypothetical protein